MHKLDTFCVTDSCQEVVLFSTFFLRQHLGHACLDGVVVEQSFEQTKRGSSPNILKDVRNKGLGGGVMRTIFSAGLNVEAIINRRTQAVAIEVPENSDGSF